MNFVPLGSIADIQLGKMLSPKAKGGGVESPYLRNQNVQWDRIDCTDLATMTFSEKERQKFSLRVGDLLVCEGGEPGRCAIWREERTDCFYQKALHRVRPHDGVANSEFLGYWIRHQAFKGAFDDQNAKTTIAHLPLVRLEQLQVPMLPVEQQVDIANRVKARLEVALTALNPARSQMSEAEALRAAIYRETFREVVPIAVIPDREHIPLGWRWTQLGEIARLESGHTPSRSRPDWWGGGVSWVSLTEIRALDGKWVEATDIKTNEKGIANSAARILPRGTVCFSRTASVGFVTIMARPMATSQDFANWVCGEDLDPEFLMHALIRSRAELRAMATGATHKTIYMPALESFRICAPSRCQQEEIVGALKERLGAVDSFRNELQSRMAEIESLPSRLLANVFGDA